MNLGPQQRGSSESTGAYFARLLKDHDITTEALDSIGLAFKEDFNGKFSNQPAFPAILPQNGRAGGDLSPESSTYLAANARWQGDGFSRRSDTIGREDPQVRKLHNRRKKNLSSGTRKQDDLRGMSPVSANSCPSSPKKNRGNQTNREQDIWTDHVTPPLDLPVWTLTTGAEQEIKVLNWENGQWIISAL